MLAEKLSNANTLIVIMSAKQFTCPQIYVILSYRQSSWRKMMKSTKEVEQALRQELSEMSTNKLRKVGGSVIIAVPPRC